MEAEASSSLHIAMYPWFALGHITPFLRVSNKLAEKGHKISFLIPTKTQSKVEHLNHFRDLITFVPITVPHVEGLPSDAETTRDVSPSLIPLIMTAMDKTEPHIELLLRDHLKPDFVFFSFVHWIPKLTRRLGIKSLLYFIAGPVIAAYNYSPTRQVRPLSEADLMEPPPDFPDLSIKLHLREARAFHKFTNSNFGDGTITFLDRLVTCFNECDALGFNACREIDGPFLDYLHKEFKKPLLISGPSIPNPSSITTPLDEQWVHWLGGFKPGSVVYCCFGSQAMLEKDQFQELVLGLELSGLPFLAVLRPPLGFDSSSIEEALPDGFKERVGGRGMVHGGWVQQPQILEHQSVGCFVTHCALGSLTEALVNQCELVLIPHMGDQIHNARLLGTSLKIGVEVEKGEEDGFFTKQNVCKAIRTVMEEEDEVGREVRANRAKLRQLLLRKDLESSYINEFNEKLKSLLVS